MTITPTNRALINYIRGIAIFLMLLGHCIQYCCGGQFDFFENEIFKIIYAFHMPLFMLISGYLFFFSARKRELPELIEYKVKSLLYPILMCSVFNLIVTKGISILRGNYNGILGGTSLTDLWFLWSVIACSIAMGFAVKITKKAILNCLLVAFGFIFISILPCWEMNVYMYPYFIAGYLYAGNREKLGKIFHLSGAISLAAFIAMLPFFKREHYIYTSGILGGGCFSENIKINFFRWGIGLFGSIAAVWICKLVHLVLTEKLKCFVEKMGEYSLAMYALSVSFLSFLLPKIANRFYFYIPINLNSFIWLYNLIFMPILAIVYSFSLLLLIKLLKKMKIYRLIFGK